MIKKFDFIFATICFLVALSNSVIFAEAQQSQDLVRCINKEKAPPETAIKACTAVIQLGQGAKGNLAVALFARGEAYRAMGEYPSAIADYTEVIKLDPKNKEAYKNRGNMYLTQRNNEDNDRAMADYNEAIKLDPNYKEAYNNRGLVYNEKGEFDRAIAEYNKALQIDAKFLLARLGRANTYRKQGDHDRALADYDEARRLDPNSTDAYPYRKKEPKCQAAVDIAQIVKPFARGEIAGLEMADKRLRIPDLTINDTRGRPRRLSEWRGRVVLLNLWAHWCQHSCLRSMQALDALQTKLGSRAFEVVNINIDTKDPKQVEDSLKRYGIKNLVNYSDPDGKVFRTETWMQDSKLAQHLNATVPIYGWPTSLLIDPQGCVMGTIAGPAEWTSDEAITLFRVIEVMLAE